MNVKKITRTTYESDEGFEFTFQPIENTIEVEKTKEGYTVKYLSPDEDYESPREWDNFGLMVCFHSRYNLGDKHNFRCPQEVLDYIKEHNAVALPLFLYDHSGLSISTRRTYPYNDRWDSGQVGWIIATEEQIKKEFGKFNEETKKTALTLLEDEIKTYDECLTGEVYVAVVETYSAEKEQITHNSVGGCYGYEHAKEVLKDLEARE